MTHEWKQGVIWFAAVAVALMLATAPVIATEHEPEAEEAFCPGSQGGYKNSDDWAVSNLTLGAQNYSEEELRAMLDAPTRGDASIILARQLIAAELNVANGHNSSVAVDAENTTADQVIAAAHELIGDQSLPANVRGKQGAQWTEYAEALDAFNNGAFTDGCSVDEEEGEEEAEEDEEESREEFEEEA